MNCSACAEHRDDVIAGRAPAEVAHAFAGHLDGCPACRAETAALRRLRDATAALPRELTPARDLWPGIADRLPPARRPLTNLRWLLPLSIAAAVALLLTVASRQFPAAGRSPAWSVAAVSGTPRIGNAGVTTEARFRVGQWLETDAASRARIAVGSIGEVRLAPNSRLRLAGAAATEHRVELARGALEAVIWAPPRLFYVDTPSGTAVDLGCAYTLAVDDAGNGELRVSAGWVALEHAGREAIVPSGAVCVTRRGAGPGTPFTVDAEPAFRTAVEAFDFGPASGRAPALAEIVRRARADDAVTLWHLLARTDGRERAAVFDRLAGHWPPPAGVSRAAILTGDVAARRAWGTQLGLGDFAPRGAGATRHR